MWGVPRRCGGQRTTFNSQFSPSTVCVPGFEPTSWTLLLTLSVFSLVYNRVLLCCQAHFKVMSSSHPHASAFQVAGTLGVQLKLRGGVNIQRTAALCYICWNIFSFFICLAIFMTYIGIFKLTPFVDLFLSLPLCVLRKPSSIWQLLAAFLCVLLLGIRLYLFFLLLLFFHFYCLFPYKIAKAIHIFWSYKSLGKI